MYSKWYKNESVLYIFRLERDSGQYNDKQYTEILKSIGNILQHIYNYDVSYENVSNKLLIGTLELSYDKSLFITV